MEFAQKLEQLVVIADVTNIKLAKWLNVDPSYVSKWRRGARSPVGNDAMLHKIANVLAPLFNTQTQREYLSQAMLNSDFQPANADFPEASIYHWFCAERKQEEMRHRELELINRPDSGMPMQANGSMVEQFAQFGEKHRARVFHRFFDLIAAGNPKGEWLIYTNECPEKNLQNQRIFDKYLKRHPKALDGITTVKLLCHKGMPASVVGTAVLALGTLCSQAVLYPGWTKHYASASPMETCNIVVPGIGCLTIMNWFGGNTTIAIIDTNEPYAGQFAKEFNAAFRESEAMYTITQGEEERKRQFIMSADHPMDCDIIMVGNILPGACLPPKEYYEVACKAFDDTFPMFYQRLVEYEKKVNAMLVIHEAYMEIPLFTPEQVENGMVHLPLLPGRVNGKPLVDPARYLRALRHMRKRCARYPNLIFHPVAPLADKYSTMLFRGISISSVRNDPFIRYVGNSELCEGYWELYENQKNAFLYENGKNIKKQRQEEAVAQLGRQIELFEEYLHSKSEGAETTKPFLTAT